MSDNTEATAEQKPDTGSEWIERFLAPGDEWDCGTIGEGEAGVLLPYDMTLVGSPASLAEFGRALVTKFGTPAE